MKTHFWRLALGLLLLPAVAMLQEEKTIAPSKEAIKGKTLKKKEEVTPKPGLLGVSPTEIYLEAKTKETATGYVQVFNQQLTQARLEATMMGVTFDSTGTEQLQDIRTFPPSSPLRHLKVTPERAIVPPKSYQTFTITTAIPAEAAGMAYARVSFASYGVDERPLSEKRKDQVSAGLLFSFALSSFVIINVADRSIYQMDIKEANLELPTKTSPLSAWAIVRNTGNTDLMAGMRVIIVDKDKKLVANLKSEGDETLRAGTIKKIAVEPLAVELQRGEYEAIFTVKTDRGLTKVLTRKVKIGR